MATKIALASAVGRCRGKSLLFISQQEKNKAKSQVTISFSELISLERLSEIKERFNHCLLSSDSELRRFFSSPRSRHLFLTFRWNLIRNVRLANCAFFDFGFNRIDP